MRGKSPLPIVDTLTTLSMAPANSKLSRKYIGPIDRLRLTYSAVMLTETDIVGAGYVLLMAYGHHEGFGPVGPLYVHMGYWLVVRRDHPSFFICSLSLPNRSGCSVTCAACGESTATLIFNMFRAADKAARKELERAE